MSADRTPCPNCGAMILEATARYNGGLCARCKIVRNAAMHERQLQEARSNASPPPINYRFFSREEFVQGLAKTCLPYDNDPKKLCGEFLAFCDPILQRASHSLIRTILFGRRRLYSNLKKLPRPFRELMAVYQAWGMLTSDGIEEYVGNTNSKFDQEVDRGLDILCQTKAKGVTRHARHIFSRNNGQIHKDDDDAIWRAFYDAMPNFETEILGLMLIELLTKKPQSKAEHSKR